MLAFSFIGCRIFKKEQKFETPIRRRSQLRDPFAATVLLRKHLLQGLVILVLKNMHDPKIANFEPTSCLANRFLF